MKSFILLGLTLAVLLSTATDGLWAQIVRVYPGGGVRVRAPFVRVDVNRWGGGTYVRAPFTEVIVPRRRYRRWRVPAYVPLDVPAIKPPVAAIYGVEDPRSEISRATRQLESDLSRYSDGASWTRYLQPGTIRDLASTDGNAPPDGSSASQLREILERYDGTVNSGQPAVILNLASFRNVHSALIQLLEPEGEQLARKLARNANELNRKLSRYPNGARWQRHLNLAKPLIADAGNTDAIVAIDDYASLLGQFDAVSTEPAYAAIANLPSFRATHDALASYVKALRDSPVESVPPVSTEELPQPPASE